MNWDPGRDAHPNFSPRRLCVSYTIHSATEYLDLDLESAGHPIITLSPTPYSSAGSPQYFLDQLHPWDSRQVDCKRQNTNHPQNSQCLGLITNKQYGEFKTKIHTITNPKVIYPMENNLDKIQDTEF